MIATEPITIPQASVMSDAGHHAVDCVEALILGLPPVEIPVKHHFVVPGVYLREASAARGTILTSRVHRFRHTFTVIEGDCAVWVEEVGFVRIRAPFCGITEAGTRRIIYVHADTRWVTVHPTNKTDISEIEDEIYEQRDIAATVPFEDLIAAAANPIEANALSAPDTTA